MAAHDTGKPKSKKKQKKTGFFHGRAMIIHTDNLRNETLFWFFFYIRLPSAAPVCGAAAATAGHPEPSQPPVSAGTGARRSAVRPAQVAAVHPVQDGPGGDPVVGGRLAVLPHVTCSLRPSSLGGPPTSVRPLWPEPPEPKKKRKKRDSAEIGCMGRIFGLG